MLAGKWTYRSYLNNPALVGSDPQKALADIFGEGVVTLVVHGHDLTGTLDMGGGYFLDLKGHVANTHDVTTVTIRGFGRAGTPTDGWEYDYHCSPAYHWPKGVNQVASLLGTVFRAKPHNGEPAGVTASFICVRQP